MLPDQDLARVVEVRQCRVAVGHDELQVFGRVRVGHGERGFEIVDDDGAAVYAGALDA